MTELCGPAPFELYDCGSGRFWLKEGRAVRLLEADDALLLQSVEGFRTLREHLSLLELRGFAEVEPGDLAARLEELRGRGLLVSAAAFVDRLPRSGGAPAAIGCAAWVTRGRPALVTRSVRSWLDRRGRVDSPRLAVLDDSEDEQSRAALGRLAEDGTPLWYAGRAEKRAFAGRLADRGIPAEVLSFALSPSPDLGTPYGANRNAFLLATCGEVVLSSDDDILFEAAALPEMDGGLAISSRLDPAGIRYFAGRESLRAALQPVGNPRALLAAHEALLGRDAGECARAAAGSVVLAELGRDLALRLTHRAHRVLLTASGLYGDSGVPGNWLLHLRDESWQRITASAEDYQTARATREVARAAPRATVCESGYLTGHHFGLDNRGLLPPFFPVGRREDGIFALTLRTTHPDALSANIPIAVLHDPAVGPGARNDGPPPPQPLFADLLSLLVASSSASRAEQGPESRIRALAAHLAGMASLEAPDLEKWVRERWVGRWASEMALCEHRMRNSPRGAPWALDSGARLEQITSHIEAGAAVHPRDLGKDNPAPSWQAARSLVRRFAELLEWWPAIVAAARELGEREQGLLAPLRT